jgi:hypothetical protein
VRLRLCYLSKPLAIVKAHSKLPFRSESGKLNLNLFLAFPPSVGGSSCLMVMAIST